MKIADDTFLGNSECEWVKVPFHVVCGNAAVEVARNLYSPPNRSLYRQSPPVNIVPF